MTLVNSNTVIQKTKAEGRWQREGRSPWSFTSFLACRYRYPEGLKKVQVGTLEVVARGCRCRSRSIIVASLRRCVVASLRRRVVRRRVGLVEWSIFFFD